MPTNVTPEYRRAEQLFREAETTEAKITALELMLQTIPKHKGTDHMRADLRRKLSKLREAPVKKAGVKHDDIFHIPHSGAGQVVLLGTPNSGKSSIVGALTNAKIKVADFPFATGAPVPGMAAFEDIQIQLIDMPPITAEFLAPGQVGTYRNSDLIAIVIDLSADIRNQLTVCLDFLESRRLLIDTETPAADKQGNRLGKRAFCICTKSDITVPDTIRTLEKFCKYPFKFVEISTRTGAGLEELTATFFHLLNIIRIYTKRPGKAADMGEPFTLPAGATVMDLAAAIHRQLSEKLKSARIWGTGVHDGQNVQRTHVLNDKDIIELHFS